jgi:hypothetical protein
MQVGKSCCDFIRQEPRIETLAELNFTALQPPAAIATTQETLSRPAAQFRRAAWTCQPSKGEDPLMQMSEIHDYARQLLSLHGDKARAVAAQRALDSEKRGEHQEAEDWRRIRDALAEMRGPHVS